MKLQKTTTKELGKEVLCNRNVITMPCVTEVGFKRKKNYRKRWQQKKCYTTTNVLADVQVQLESQQRYSRHFYASCSQSSKPIKALKGNKTESYS